VLLINLKVVGVINGYQRSFEACLDTFRLPTRHQLYSNASAIIAHYFQSRHVPISFHLSVTLCTLFFKIKSSKKPNLFTEFILHLISRSKIVWPSELAELYIIYSVAILPSVRVFSEDFSVLLKIL